MSRTTRTFTHKDSPKGPVFTSDAYTDDGGRTWHWVSNDAVCPLDACQSYGIPCDPEAQAAARLEELSAFAAEYRARYRGPSPEQRMEARAAHGPGVTLVNVITGDQWTT